MNVSGGIFRLICAALTTGMVSAWLMAVESGSATTIAPQNLSRIKEAQKVGDLMALGKQFSADRKVAAAKACITRVCELEPALLTNNERLAPRTWNELWFLHRARLRERVLSDTDAKGRLEIAQWLHEGRLIPQAREFLTSALAIDPDLEEAKQLAEVLRPQLGLDLRLAIRDAVFLESFTDEGEEIEARRGYTFFVAPVYYLVTERGCVLTASMAKIETDEGKRLRARGLLLTGGTLRPTESEEEQGPLISPPIDLPSKFNAVIYERFQTEYEDGKRKLVWMNTISPRRTGGNGRRSSTSGEKRGEFEPTGWAALLIEMPEDANSLNVTLPDGEPEEIDLELVRLIEQATGNQGTGIRTGGTRGRGGTGGARDGGADGADWEETLTQAERIGDYAIHPSAVTAQLAIVWLAEAVSDRSSRRTVENKDALMDVVERALLEAMAHNDMNVRKQAFKAMIASSRPLSEAAQAFVMDPAEAAVLFSILEEVETALTTADKTQGAAPTGRTSRFTGGNDEAAVAKAIASRPLSQAPDNLFMVLAACMRSPHKIVRQRAMQILLADATQQSTRILAELDPQARAALITEFEQITDKALKGAVIRVLMIHPDDTTTALLEQCKDLSLEIVSPTDPLLLALEQTLPDETIEKLLIVLKQADLTKVIQRPETANTLAALAVRYEDKAAIRQALLNMLAVQFNFPYESPISRQHGGRPSPLTRTATGRETQVDMLLARLVTDSDLELEPAQKGAIALVRSGRILSLVEQIEKSEDDRRNATLVEGLLADQSLWKLDALSQFLASCVSKGKQEVQRKALAGLVAIRDHRNEPDAWQARLAVREGLDVKVLVGLTDDRDEETAEAAFDLTSWVSLLPREQAATLRQIPNHQTRLDRINQIKSRRSENPSGVYACMVFLDTQEMPPAGAGAPQPGSTRPNLPIIRRSIPLAATGEITVEKDSTDKFRIQLDGKSINTDPTHPVSGRVSRTHARRLFAVVNAGPLLSAAVRSQDAKDANIAERVDMLPLAGNIPCNLTIDETGRWMGEVVIQASRAGATTRRELQATGAKIVLEPLEY